jgi:hypothetical protein
MQLSLILQKIEQLFEVLELNVAELLELIDHFREDSLSPEQVFKVTVQVVWLLVGEPLLDDLVN